MLARQTLVDGLGVLHRLQHLKVITGHLGVLFRDVKPALLWQANRHIVEIATPITVPLLSGR